MAKTSPVEFLRQVRQEVSKVTFPTRKETMISATMVFVMVVIAALFLLLTDSVVQFLIKTVLGFGQ